MELTGTFQAVSATFHARRIKVVVICQIIEYDEIYNYNMKILQSKICIIKSITVKPKYLLELLYK